MIPLARRLLAGSMARKVRRTRRSALRSAERESGQVINETAGDEAMTFIIDIISLASESAIVCQPIIVAQSRGTRSESRC